MTKRIQPVGTPLDREVVAFLRRLGRDDASPLMHMICYSVRRTMDGQHRVTVEFFADDEFDADRPGWLPPERVAELRALAEVDQHGDFGAETIQGAVEAILDDTPRSIGPSAG